MNNTTKIAAALAGVTVVTLGISTTTTSGGASRLYTNSPLLSGSGTTANPLKMTVVADASLTGTGSAGAPFSAETAIGELDYGLFGDGSDGACNFDGANPVLGISPGTCTDGLPVSGCYTLTREIFCENMTVASGAQVTGPYRIFVHSTLTLNGKIQRNGIRGGCVRDTNAALGGAALPSGYLGGSTAGGVGSGLGGFCSGSAGLSFSPTYCQNTGGVGGAQGGGAGTPGTPGGLCRGGGGGGTNVRTGCNAGVVSPLSLTETNTAFFRSAVMMTSGRNSNFPSVLTGGTGGAGGGSQGCSGGAGGGGAAPVVVSARTIVGAGSIEAKGGDGGNGSNSTDGVCLPGNLNCGNPTPTQGGGGGGGGGGGTVVVVIGAGDFPAITAAGGLAGSRMHCTAASDGAPGGDGKVYRFRARISE